MRATQLAAFCLSTGVQPSEARALSRLERDEFWRLLKEHADR